MARLPNLRTIQSFRVDGLTELEVVLTEMALAAACEVSVLDPISTLSDMIEAMRWGYNVITPRQLLREAMAARGAA